MEITIFEGGINEYQKNVDNGLRYTGEKGALQKSG